MHRILFIDDNIDVLDLVKLILERKGFIVSGCDNGYYIEQKIREHNPHIIFLDVHLEKLDGRDVCRKIKTTDGIKHLPVILFSSDVQSDHDMVKCKANGFLKKPFEIPELLDKIRPFVAA